VRAARSVNISPRGISNWYIDEFYRIVVASNGLLINPNQQAHGWNRGLASFFGRSQPVFLVKHFMK